MKSRFGAGKSKTFRISLVVIATIALVVAGGYAALVNSYRSDADWEDIKSYAGQLAEKSVGAVYATAEPCNSSATDPSVTLVYDASRGDLRDKLAYVLKSDGWTGAVVANGEATFVRELAAGSGSSAVISSWRDSTQQLTIYWDTELTCL